MQGKEISQAVIARLPRYHRYLRELKLQGKLRISSQELASIMKVTASQIRQDFNNFGGFGQQGYGYNVEYLYDEIDKILGLNEKKHLIIIGYGNMAHALVKYTHFLDNGFVFEAAFDLPEKVAMIQDAAIPLYAVTEMSGYIREHSIKMAVLAVPKSVAQETALCLVENGIKAIWNFSPIDLEVPDGVKVENVHLQDSLMKLSYNANQHEKTD